MERQPNIQDVDNLLSRRRLLQLAAISAGAVAVSATLPLHVQFAASGVAVRSPEARAATQGTLTLQPATYDSYVQQDAPTTNFGSSVLLNILKNTDNTDRHALLAFDLSSIPANAVVTAATLTLWNSNTSTASRSYDVFKLVTANNVWTEMGATWQTVDGTTNWAGGQNGAGISGTDHDATALGSFSYTANDAAETAHPCSLNTSEVGETLGGTLHLLIKRTTIGSGNAPSWRSSNTSVTERRPKLVVEYTVGQTYYLATNGNNTNDGLSLGEPWQTFAFALEQLGPGDTLLVRGGAYNESPMLGEGDTAAGTASAPIIVQNYNGESVWINGRFKINSADYWTFDGINVDGNSITSYDPIGVHMVNMRGGRNWTWKRSEFRNGRFVKDLFFLGSSEGCQDWLLQDCWFHRNYGIEFAGLPNDDPNGNGINQDHCVYVTDSINGIIERCLMTDTPNGRGIKVGSTNSSDVVPDGLTIRYCTMYNNLGPSSINFSMGARNTTVHHCVFQQSRSGYENVTHFQLNTANGAVNNVVKNCYGWESTDVVDPGSSGLTEGSGSEANSHTDPILLATYEPQLAALKDGNGVFTHGHLKGLSGADQWVHQTCQRLIGELERPPGSD